MKIIKRIHIKTVCNIDCYETNKYEVRISKDFDGKVEVQGCAIGDKEGLFYPTFRVINGYFMVNSAMMRISVERIDELIDALKDLKEIHKSLPELLKLGEQIPLPE